MFATSSTHTPYQIGRISETTQLTTVNFTGCLLDSFCTLSEVREKCVGHPSVELTWKCPQGSKGGLVTGGEIRKVGGGEREIRKVGGGERDKEGGAEERDKKGVGGRGRNKEGGRRGRDKEGEGRGRDKEGGGEGGEIRKVGEGGEIRKVGGGGEIRKVGEERES